MTEYVYHFAAKGIQRYVLAGGRLIDIAGASELLAAAIRSDGQDLLEKILDQAGLCPNHPTGALRFSRRAGGVFLMHYTPDEQQTVDRFRALWRLAFAHHAPGLEFTETIACGASQKEAAERAKQTGTDLRENGPSALLPIAGPFAARTPRTGLAAIGTDYDEAVDLPTRHKRAIMRHPRTHSEPARFTDRFLPDDTTPESIVWPTDLGGTKAEDEAKKKSEEAPPKLFPFRGTDRRIGIVHADISGLGQLFSHIYEKNFDKSFDLATTIEHCITDAARQATKAVLLPQKKDDILPARPILLGGDDLTIIVRADLAIAYARHFLETLERESREALARFDHPHPLTACAGIAIISAHQPFHQALDLAESLCRYAKSRVKEKLSDGTPVPSAIAFHVVLDSLIGDDYDAVRRTAFQVKDDPHSFLTGQPYLVGQEKKEELFTLDALDKLKSAFGHTELATGPVRDLQRLLLTEGKNSPLFKTAWANWQKIAKARHGDAFGAFDTALKAFKIEIETTDLALGFFAHGKTPLFDALSWQGLETFPEGSAP